MYSQQLLFCFLKATGGWKLLSVQCSRLNAKQPLEFNCCSFSANWTPLRHSIEQRAAPNELRNNMLHMFRATLFFFLAVLIENAHTPAPKGSLPANNTAPTQNVSPFLFFFFFCEFDHAHSSNVTKVITLCTASMHETCVQPSTNEKQTRGVKSNTRNSQLWFTQVK